MAEEDMDEEDVVDSNVVNGEEEEEEDQMNEESQLPQQQVASRASTPDVTIHASADAQNSFYPVQPGGSGSGLGQLEEDPADVILGFGGGSGGAGGAGAEDIEAISSHADFGLDEESLLSGEDYAAPYPSSSAPAAAPRTWFKWS